MKDLIKAFREEARLIFIKQLHRIQQVEPQIEALYNLSNLFAQALPDCEVRASGHTYSPTISIFLSKGYNVSKHVMECIDEYNDLCSALGKTDTYEYIIDSNSRSVDFHWDNLHIYVYIDGGNCELIPDGMETIQKPKYKVECH